MKTNIRTGFVRGFHAMGIVGLLALGATPLQAAPKKDKEARTPKEAEAPKGAAVVFPVKGNLDPDQGTIEAIFALSYSFGDQMIADNRSATWLFPFVAVHDKTGVRYDRREDEALSFHIGFLQHHATDRLTLWSNRFERPREYGEPVCHIAFSVDPGQTPQLKAGEWHTLAATWQRKNDRFDLELYLDGKSVRAHDAQVSPTKGNAKFDSRDLLYIGNPYKSLGSLQSLRISKRARTAEEIAAADKAGLVKDADTLLYIDADIIAAMRTDKREDLLGGKTNPKSISVPPEGKVFGKVEITAGRNGGKAVRFQAP